MAMCGFRHEQNSEKAGLELGPRAGTAFAGNGKQRNSPTYTGAGAKFAGVVFRPVLA